MKNKEYAQYLCIEARNSCVSKRAEVSIREWKPVENMCHHNVSIWCANNPSYTPVRGWLYFNLPGFPHVKFVSHSVVRAPDKELYDITPSNASKDYPFVESNLSEEEYAELIEIQGVTEIVHAE